MAYNNWGKKAQSEDVFWFAFFYGPLTAFVVLSLILMPRALMEQSLQPIPLDQTVQARQLNARLWQTDTITGRTSPFEYDFTEKIDETYSKKAISYKVQIGEKEEYYNKELYDRAEPIAPARYLPYSERRMVIVDGTKKEITITEYYPKKYEIAEQT